MKTQRSPSGSVVGRVGTRAFALLLAFGAFACEVHMGTQDPAVAPPAASAAPANATAATATAAAPPPGTPPPPRVVSLHVHGTPAANPGGAAPAVPATAAPVAPPSPAMPAPTCLDTGAASIGDCGALAPPDPSCASAPVAATRCAAFKAYFAPKVAAAAVSCLAALTSKQVCDPAAVDGCGRAALAQACPDPSIAQLCAVAGTPCRSSSTDCTSTVSGLSAQGKQQVAQCVAAGCVAGLYGCVSTVATTQSALTIQ